MEDLAYRRLLDEYYLHERPLNSGIASVARQIGMREFHAEVEFILDTFFSLTEAGWTNKRADDEINRFHELRENASRAGKASAAKRAFNGRSTNVQLNMNHEPLTINHKPLKPKATATLLPEWLDENVWSDFKSHRVAAKSKMTANAEALAIGELSKLKAQGHDPTEVIKQSIMRGWKGLFALNGHEQSKGKTRHEQHSDFVAELTGRNKRKPVDDPTVINGTAERLD